MADLPHTSWGNDLTLEYQGRARIFSVRTLMNRVGSVAFYALPLLPIYATSDYTPQTLQHAVYIGAGMMLLGLLWALKSAPAGITVPTARQDSATLLLHSLIHNKPLLVFFAAFGLTGLCYGMWFGLLYFYLDSYLGRGDQLAMMFITATVLSAVSLPGLLALIRRTSKSTVWAVGIVLFIGQLIGAGLMSPGIVSWLPFMLVPIALLSFACQEVAALSILGDIADYGKLKFRRDRTTTYFACVALLFQIAVGLGGGLAMKIASYWQFQPAATAHTSSAIFGLKLGFVIVPVCWAFLGLIFILLTPIDRRRHGIIQRRLESRRL
jgi:Na+/melibiose symporter-like transporter